MNQVLIIGLGAGDLDQLPLGVYKQLKNTDHLYLRTKEHPLVQQLSAEGIDFLHLMKYMKITMTLKSFTWK